MSKRIPRFFGAALFHSSEKERAWVFVSIVVYIAGILLISGLHLYLNHHAAMNRIDERLRIAAEIVPSTLDESFIDRDVERDEGDPAVFYEMCEALTRQSRCLGVDELYVLRVDASRLFILAYSYPEGEEYASDNPGYGDEYTESTPEFIETLGSTNVYYETYKDQWGTRRGATVTRTTAKGTMYVSGADYRIDYVMKTLVTKTFVTMGEGLFFLCLALPLLWSFNRLYRRAAVRLHKANIQLQADIRMRESAEDELKRAYENLKKVEHFKNGIMQLLAHEMKTPINGINGFSDLLLSSSSLSSEEREYVSMIRDCGLYLAEFADKAILYEKLKSGYTLRPTNADVGRSLQRIAHIKSSETHRITVLGNEGVMWRADWDLMNTALTLLVDNAVKYSGSTGNISVGYHIKDKELVIAIRDRGHGIAPEKLHGLFDQSVVEDIAHHGQGQRISLPLCKCVAEMHNGMITVESEVDRGTTVCVTIGSGDELDV
ncbi:MAG: HAMP domain-containing histidine kinase [Spartobacteria bacterium]|nr:HAMP domain-containing histidine kinase [Spartobacteria bacterium]